MTKDELKRAAHKTTDEHGQPIVQIPLDMWEEYVEKDKSEEELPQHVRIIALLDEWDKHPEDDESEEWWAEFDAFMRENRFTIEERDIDWGDE